MEPGSRAEPKKPNDGPIRVLVVEDDAEMRDALREILEISGFFVRTAGDADHAAEMAEDAAFDVLLSDVRLPGQSGIALARRLKARPQPLQVILMTAYPEWKVYEEAAGAGASVVITKPLDLFKLAGIIQEVARSGKPAA